MAAKQFLDDAYYLDTGAETKVFYDDWSESYDTEVADNGYATPARAAGALAVQIDDLSEPLLDLGCGTGVSGAAFRHAGFTTIDGTDFSERMLKMAEQKEIYRNLFKSDLNNPLPFPDGAYRLVAAIGVMNPGHATAELFDQVMAKLPSGGLFVFSLNDHALADPSYEARLNEYLDCGHAVLLSRDYGEHLPKIGLKSTVYVVAKT